MPPNAHIPCNIPPKLHSSPIRPHQTPSLSRTAIPSNHLAQLIFLRKLSAQNLEIGDKGFAAVDQCFFRGDLAVGLDSEFDRCEEGVGDCGGAGLVCVRDRGRGGRAFVAGEGYVLVFEEMCA